MAGGVELIPCPQGAARLDRWLAEQPSFGSRRRAREAITTGKVKVGGRFVAAEESGLPLPAGAVVEIHWNRSGTSRAAARGTRALQDARLRILHEDRDLVVVDKPPGLLTDVAPGQADRDSVVKRLQQYLQPRGGRALVCHRIDRDTSGVVVLARHETAHQALREAFARHVPERVYLAFVQGVVGPDEAAWHDTMRWDKERLRQLPCPPDTPRAMPARSTAKVVARFPDATLLEVRLDTGRRNQIRLQASLRGHPLIGERIYLPRELRGVPATFPRQALHAWQVAFPHPNGGRTVRVTSPLPPDLAALRQRLEQG